MKTVKVTEFGARGDGCSDDSEAFQKALDFHPAAIEIPAGHYKIGVTLRIHSGTQIKADLQATMFLADGAAQTSDDYLITNGNPEAGDRDISIEGGIWDGNNAGNPRPPGLFADGYTGTILHFRNVSDFRLTNMHFSNAEAYHARFTLAYRFQIEGIRFSSKKIRPNNDGIHLGGFCGDGVIRDIKGLHEGVTGDDMVALNADDAPGRNEVRGMLCGPIRNIQIEDIEAYGCHTFVRLLSVWSAIENIKVRRVRGTCEIAALNCDAARGCRVPLFDGASPPYPDGVGMLRNIEADDMQVSKSAGNSIALLRLETRMENFRLTNFKRLLDLDKSPAQPAVRIQHTEIHNLVLHPDPVAKHLAADGIFESHQADIPLLSVNEC